MTANQLALFLGDEFHDWIDGDDPVSDYNRLRNTVWVKFESGAQFMVTIEEVYE